MTLQTEQQATLTIAQTLIDRTLRFLGVLAVPSAEPRPSEPPRTRMNAGLHPDLVSYDWGHIGPDR